MMQAQDDGMEGGGGGGHESNASAMNMSMDGSDPSVATMSDQQFRASLDALLGDMESMVGTTTTTTTTTNTTTCDNVTTTSAVVPSQTTTHDRCHSSRSRTWQGMTDTSLPISPPTTTTTTTSAAPITTTSSVKPHPHIGYTQQQQQQQLPLANVATTLGLGGQIQQQSHQQQQQQQQEALPHVQSMGTSTTATAAPSEPPMGTTTTTAGSTLAGTSHLGNLPTAATTATATATSNFPFHLLSYNPAATAAAAMAAGAASYMTQQQQQSFLGSMGGGGAGGAFLNSTAALPPTTTTSNQDAFSFDGKPPAAKRRRTTMSGYDTMSTISAVSEDEGERERRRQDRNMREQLRSHQITTQIAQLGTVLKGANLQFKPDKYSTLVTVVDYIKALQKRNDLLDSEHRKLIDTITKTTEIVNNQYVPARDTEPEMSNLLAEADPNSATTEDDSMVFVQGIDYKAIFECCHVACGVTRIDGRFIDCNKEFEDITGYPREELLPLEKRSGDPASSASRANERADSPLSSDETSSMTQSSNTASAAATSNMSLFNILDRTDMEQVFAAMSEMLKKPTMNGGEVNRKLDTWTHLVRLCRRQDVVVRLCVDLVRTCQGRPRFFNCLVVPT